MPDHSFFVLRLLAALGCGLMAGTFFAFSAFIMRALAQVPAAHAVGVMQAMNRVIVRTVFLAVFLGTAIVAAILAILSWVEDVTHPTFVHMHAGAICYLVGCIGVTMLCNVPLNNRLAALDSNSATAQASWREYTKIWTRWNHVRSVASLFSTFFFVVG